MITHRFIEVDSAQQIGVITLNNPKSLNALTYEMVQSIHQHLTDWAADDRIVAVLMHGAGDKAFCAGGDIRGLYYGYDPTTFPNPVAERFFGTEYDLCKKINSYNKPIIIWGSGIVMGGGMGLAVPSSHRIVTEATMMAMPEVTIGLFPDAGGSYFLGQMPDRIGLFLGLTGARFNGADALALGVADFAMASDSFDQLIDALAAAQWCDDAATNHQMLNQLIGSIEDRGVLPSGWLLAHRDEITQIMQASSLKEFDAIAKDTQIKRSDYVARALDQYAKGSPTSAAIAWYLHHRIDGMDFDAVMDLEYLVAIHCADRGEFAEGVRALLIDKDKRPKWRYTLADMPKDYAKSHTIPW